jgi:hypothetical protein
MRMRSGLRERSRSVGNEAAVSFWMQNALIALALAYVVLPVLIGAVG